jgi:hypothetical protein
VLERISVAEGQRAFRTKNQAFLIATFISDVVEIVGNKKYKKR